ncbi:hypothetical protein AAFF_G00269030 [Aldrovandia affinis]|uniref:Uncharacterized protein n=1 Tax=Aldrovandia affinis TaxID=143900 RepID=A0AAD7SS72_9TELE|nr:hypothetical protein AAFF_G00269030 [Aldrovandia affinis]
MFGELRFIRRYNAKEAINLRAPTAGALKARAWLLSATKWAEEAPACFGQAETERSSELAPPPHLSCSQHTEVKPICTWATRKVEESLHLAEQNTRLQERTWAGISGEGQRRGPHGHARAAKITLSLCLGLVLNEAFTFNPLVIPGPFDSGLAGPLGRPTGQRGLYGARLPYLSPLLAPAFLGLPCLRTDDNSCPRFPEANEKCPRDPGHDTRVREGAGSGSPSLTTATGAKSISCLATVPLPHSTAAFPPDPPNRWHAAGSSAGSSVSGSSPKIPYVINCQLHGCPYGTEAALSNPYSCLQWPGPPVV